MVESFDWSMYAVLVPFFAAELFGGAGAGSLLAAYAGFAVGFVARPLGSVVIGRISDVRGRRTGLVVAMAGISAASLGLAVTPSSGTIGVWAGVLVVVFRLVQGLAYGGEAPTVAAYVTETAPPTRRFLFSAVSYSGNVVGSLLAFGVVAIMYAVLGKEGLAEGGWRWGFGAAALVGLAALWVRRSAPESEDFLRVKAEAAPRPGIRAALRDHRWSALTQLLFTVGSTVSFYFCLLYLPTYAAGIGAAEQAYASSFMTLVLVFVLVAMLAGGLAADRFGPLRVLRTGLALQPMCLPPLLYAMQYGLLPFQVVAVALGVLLAPLLALGNVLAGMLYPTEVRAMAAGLVAAVGVTAFGGTFPLLAEWMHGRGAGAAIPYYVTICLLVPLAGLFTMRRVPGLVADLSSTAPLAATTTGRQADDVSV
ncbi:MFS transporter [Streptomyces geranii]|uniref:MFS transporter n=1 Tax=Streptomyces geranii TaxID=2058923 RepID=UPI001300729E|nr:MFS transporter [Streptomyces geranii]